MVSKERPIESLLDELDDEVAHSDHMLGLLAVIRDLLGQVVVGSHRLKHKPGSLDDAVETKEILGHIERDYPYLSKEQLQFLKQTVIFHNAARKWDKERIENGMIPAWKDDHPLSEISELNFIPAMCRCHWNPEENGQ